MEILSTFLIKIVFIFEYLIHGLLMPFVFLLLPFIKKLRVRYSLEMKFNSKNITLHPEFCFEVSSEGEFEQIAPIMMSLLKNNKAVQLIIGSKSLVTKALELEGHYKSLDVRMVPLVSFFWIKTPFTSNLFSLISTGTLVLCRYDFFPELMIIGWRKSKKFILVSASLKNKSVSGLSGFYWKGVYSLFSQIIAASSFEKRQIQTLLPNYTGPSFDFRQLQILDRIETSSDKLNSWNNNQQFLDIINIFSKMERIIIGSCWEPECDIFLNKELVKDIIEKKVIVVIAPHILSDFFIQNLSDRILNYSKDLNVQVISDLEFQTNTNAGFVYILQKAGILVEIYQLFGHAFVGGGYGRSIHSVLEPYISGCQVYCGPKTHRSTEFDLIISKNKEQAIIIENQVDFYQKVKEKNNAKISMAIIERTELTHSFEKYLDFLLEGS